MWFLCKGFDWKVYMSLTATLIWLLPDFVSDDFYVYGHQKGLSQNHNLSTIHDDEIGGPVLPV